MAFKTCSSRVAVASLQHTRILGKSSGIQFGEFVRKLSAAIPAGDTVLISQQVFFFDSIVWVNPNPGINQVLGSKRTNPYWEHWERSPCERHLMVLHYAPYSSTCPLQFPGNTLPRDSLEASRKRLFQMTPVANRYRHSSPSRPL